MKILKPSLDHPLDWEVIHEGLPNVIEVELWDGQIMEISEETGADGLRYLCLRTRQGTIAIYPEVSNVLWFRVQTPNDTIRR